MEEKELERIIDNFFSKLDRTQRGLERKIEENIMEEKDLEIPNIQIGLTKVEDIPENFFISGEYLRFDSNKLDRGFSIYLDESYSTISKIIIEDRIYRGNLIDKDDIEIPFEYKILQNKSFIEYEEEVRKFLFENNIDITPIFNPYSRKVFNIKIINILENIEYKKIKSYDLGEFEQTYKIKKNYTPIWNIELKKDQIIQLSVVPDKKNKFFCIEVAAQNDVVELYKSKETIIDHCVKNGEFIKLYFEKEIKRWDICKIYTVSEERKGFYSNKSFDIDILNKFGSYIPRTKFEIERRIQTLAKVLELKYIEYELEKDKIAKKIEKYAQEFAYFKSVKIDFLDFSAQRKNLYLKLEYSEDVLYEDKVNYLIACMTSIYPEINWIGVYNE